MKTTSKPHAPLEYAGDLKFEPSPCGPITPETTMDEWEDAAQHEYVFNKLAQFILSCSDEELEAFVLEKVNARVGVCFLTDTAGYALDFVKKKQASIDVYNSVSARCTVVRERIAARHLAN